MSEQPVQNGGASKQVNKSEGTPSGCCGPAKWLLFWLCCAAAVQGMVVNGFVNVAISTIEKRYDLPSRITGLISSSYDIACMFVSIPCSYFGSRPGASKPRWLGCGLIIMGLGSLVFASPHLLAPSYIDPQESSLFSQEARSEDSQYLCLKKNSTSCSEEEASYLTNYRYLFILGQCLTGLGAVPLYTLGVAYIDESVVPALSALYLGIFFAMSVVGPAFGYGLGGQFLQVYIDSPVIDPMDIGLNSSSDLWLGAWWIGFFVTGISAIVVAIPILMLPAVIPKDPESQQTQSPRNSADDVITSADFQKVNFKSTSLSLLKNKTFIALSISESFDGFVVAGLAAFLPKVIENMFNISASMAALTIGALAVSAGGGATFLGGWVIKRFNQSCLTTIKMCFVVSLFCFGLSFSFLMLCPNNDFAGVTSNYEGEGVPLNINITSECNADCHCNDVPFTPICGSDGVTYFSPCHAGCKDSYTELGTKVIGECSCIQSSKDVPSLSKMIQDEASFNKCDSVCTIFIPYLACIFFTMFSMFFVAIPNVSTTLRSVGQDERAYALGLQAISFRALGTIPSPILFGLAIDRACVLWQSTCGQEGSCLYYDNYYISRYLFVLSMMAKFVSTLGFLFAWVFYKKEHLESGEGANGAASISSTPLESVTSNGERSGYENRALDAS